MILHKQAPKNRTLQATIGKGEYDLEFSAMLFFMFRAGLLKQYPLDPVLYPDTPETEKRLAYIMLRMKLREDLSGFRNNLCCKTVNNFRF